MFEFVVLNQSRTFPLNSALVYSLFTIGQEANAYCLTFMTLFVKSPL